MKANRTASLSRHDEAVTSVLGAILVAALVVALLIMVRVQFVPVWEKNAEAAHMLQVENELSMVRAQIDRQASNTSIANVANQVTLGDARASIFAQRSLPPSITFRPNMNTASVDAQNISIFITDGVFVPVADNEWVEIEDTPFVDNVQQALALRLRVEDPSNLASGQNVRIVVTQEDGSYGGEFRLTIDDAPSQYILRHDTYNKNNEIVTSISTSYHIATSLSPYYYVNVLEDNYVFDQVLAAANAPVALTLTATSGIDDASYSIIYFEGDGSGGTVLVGGGGIRIENFLREFSGGVITYAANNNHYVAQTFVVEHGALILVQFDGAVFKVPPGFAVTQVGNTTGVTVTLPVLTGLEKALSGQMVSIVNTQRGAGHSFVGSTEAFNYTVQTEYPSLWRQFFFDKFRDQGLVLGTHYTLQQAPSSVKLTVLGSSADPDVQDISLSLVQANIVIRLEA